jgi:Transposase DDE domain
LSTLPEDTSIHELVDIAHQRWRIERDYQDLKQDFGLGHYEGRGWRGFHHHAVLSIAAYGFLMAERLVADKSVGGKKNFIERQVPALPEDYIPRGSPTRAAPRGDIDHDTASSTELPADRPPRPMSLLRPRKQ